MNLSKPIGAIFIALLSIPAPALERQDTTFKVFQFPANLKPRIDGKSGRLEYRAGQLRHYHERVHGH